MFAAPLLSVLLASSSAAEPATRWVGTWTTAPQLVETNNNPPSPGLSGNSLRQVVRVSLGGDTLRLKLSNEFSTASTELKAVTIALSKGSGAIDPSTLKSLSFSGKSGSVLAAGAAVVSDPVAFPVGRRADVAITIWYGQASASVTGHPGSRTTSYLLAGDKSTAASFPGATTTEHWYTINTIDVRASSAASAVAVLGNSITDGRGSTTDQQNRWTDVLSEALLANPSTAQVAMLNLGIGGNCVLSGGLGPTGTSRYKRDILDQQGVAWVMILEGVNDIGGVSSAAAATTVSDNLIAAYKRMAEDAHAKGLKVYGATIMPFGGNGYYNQSSEACRAKVNAWIRTTRDYDAVVDFDRMLRGASDTTKLGVGTFQNDGLHPDAAGYQKMGRSVDPSLFATTPVGAAPHDGFRPAGARALTLREGRLRVEYGRRRADGGAATLP